MLALLKTDKSGFSTIFADFEVENLKMETKNDFPYFRGRKKTLPTPRKVLVRTPWKDSLIILFESKSKVEIWEATIWRAWKWWRATKKIRDFEDLF